jgi:hypothetical protein
VAKAKIGGSKEAQNKNTVPEKTCCKKDDAPNQTGIENAKE